MPVDCLFLCSDPHDIIFHNNIAACCCDNVAMRLAVRFPGTSLARLAHQRDNNFMGLIGERHRLRIDGLRPSGKFTSSRFAKKHFRNYKFRHTALAWPERDAEREKNEQIVWL
jgi:hypothetical protein